MFFKIQVATARRALRGFRRSLEECVGAVVGGGHSVGECVGAVVGGGHTWPLSSWNPSAHLALVCVL